MAAITVFGKPNCVQCTQTVKKFEREGLEAGHDFIYRDVTQDPAAYSYITDELGYSAAPVVVLTDDDHWSGMHPDNNKRAIAWALKQRESTPVEVAPAPAPTTALDEPAPSAAGPEPPAQDNTHQLGQPQTATIETTPTPAVIDLRDRLAAKHPSSSELATRMNTVTAAIATQQASVSVAHQPYQQAVVNGPQA